MQQRFFSRKEKDTEMQFLPTDFLTSEEIKLILYQTDEGNPEKNWVPAYHFAICNREGTKMSTCDLRICSS